MIGSSDAEKLEYFLLGDLNLDHSPTNGSLDRNKLIDMSDIHGIEQLENEPARNTATSYTLATCHF